MYKSIQDGACCADCFARGVSDLKQNDPDKILALSEEFRFGAAQVIGRVVDSLEGVQDPFPIEHGYVDRVILKVTEDEIIIIRNDASADGCLGWSDQIKHR